MVKESLGTLTTKNISVTSFRVTRSSTDNLESDIIDTCGFCFSVKLFQHIGILL